MSSKRTLVIAIIAIILVLAALGTFALWLFGRSEADVADDGPGTGVSDTGIVFVRAIDTYGDARVTLPVGIGAGSDGGFFVTLRDQSKVVEYDAQGDYVQSWGEHGLESGQLMVPLGVAVDRAGDRVYVTDRSRLRLICYDLTGAYRWEIPIINPLTPAITPAGIAVTTYGQIVLFDPEGVVLGEFGSRGELPGQFDYARGITAAGEDGAFVADSNNTRVQRIEFSGEATATVNWVYGRPPLNQADATTVFGLPVSATTDEDGNLYILDAFRGEIAVLDPESGEETHRFVFSTGTVPGEVYMPSGLAYLGGDTFAITDTANDRIEIFRLLLPEENTIIARTPWLWWLLAIPLLVLLLALGKKRWFVTEETLDRAAADGQVRLLAAVFKRMYVLPAVYERFGEYVEDGTSLGEYFIALDTGRSTADTPLDAEALLAESADRTLGQKLLLRRHTVVCVDDAQEERFAQRKRRTRGYDAVLAEYVLDAGEADRG